MALIGTIRKNSWFLVLVLGSALAAFIIMDMTSNRGGVGAQFRVGEVGDTEIGYQEFSNAQSALYQGNSVSQFEQRDYIWNFFVEEALVNQEAEGLGLTVGFSEMDELQFGSNLSPVIQARFINPSTGIVDRNQLNQIRQALNAGQLNPQYQNYWNFQKQEIRKERIQSKISNMVRKSIYTPTWLAEMSHLDQNTNYEFSYVNIPFDDIDDSEISVTDADLTSYINNHKKNYTISEEERELEMVIVDVLPNEQDSLDIKNTISDLMSEFQNSTDDSLFVENNYGTIDVVYFPMESISPVIAESLFDAEIGSVLGPYIDVAERSYKAVKLLDKKMIPDSVKSRHILRQAADANSLQIALAYVDSIKTLIETGVESFDSMAVKNSQDFVSGAKAGDLGYIGVNGTVKPFNDVLFYTGEPGELNTVISQFGVHLIEITGRKYDNKTIGAQVAYLSEPIIPSENTQNEIYEETIDFLGDIKSIQDLREKVSTSENYRLETTEYLKINDAFLTLLGTNQTSREIVRWAFDYYTEKGDVSPEVYTLEDEVQYFNSKYIVAGLSNIQEKGQADLNNVREEVELIVKNEKKGELIASKINGKSLSDVETEFNVKVDTAFGVSFASGFIPGLGDEPKVIASASHLEIDQVSSPIVGNNGVYLIRLTDKVAPYQDPDIPSLRNSTFASERNGVTTYLIDALKKAVKVSDNRHNFF